MMRNLPWLWPGILVSIGLAWAVRQWVARRLGTSDPVAALLLASIGLIVSATLTPLRGAFENGAVGTGICDFSRLGPPPLAQLTTINDTSLNVLLFVPLGVAIGLLPRSAPRLVLAASAIGLPFVIETVQLLVPSLLRGCESADVIDNLLGLLVGWLAVAIWRRVLGDH